MSLEPGWYSTIFGVYHFAGLFLAAIAAIVLLALWLERAGPLAGVLHEDHLHDFGKLIFSFSTFWAYIWFSQYMLIWYANIPEETTYFVARTHGAWLGFFVLNVVLNWGVPFAVLIRRDTKRDRRVLATVAVVVLVGRWIDLYLMILPPIIGERALPGLLEIGVLAGGAGLFGLALARALRASPIVPIGDPDLRASLQYES
jgi:Ni/Fe-hydrogenase subunit HybB-like protein